MQTVKEKTRLEDVGRLKYSVFILKSDDGASKYRARR